MVEKKPTYDELRESLRESESYCLMINSVLCLVAGALYFYFISALLEYATIGMSFLSPSDNLPPVMIGTAYVFAVTYGLWHIFCRLWDIWVDDLNKMFDEIADVIDRIFRGIAKAFNEDDKAKPNGTPKKLPKDQAELSMES
jgi:hypothetical protein